MTLPQRIHLLSDLGKVLAENDSAWVEAKLRAERENGWFTQSFIDRAVQNITDCFLKPGPLEAFAAGYPLEGTKKEPKTVGLVMAGNIPLVGFHDFLCVFLSGHRVIIKPSSKDEVLIKHVIDKMIAMDHAVQSVVQFAPLLKGCDAYIATGSNNSARYFDYYFGKYPHIIRRNRTSVAILNGNETMDELALLADDVHLYFGLGCRNVTKLLVPRDYDFVPLLEVFKKYHYFTEHHKYKNNYDYQLAMHILNHQYYMTNGSVLLTENESVFSPISQLNYSFYPNGAPSLSPLLQNPDIQCIAGKDHLPFGRTQSPSLTDFADGTDTMQFLSAL